jgi:hypothetical protein
VVVSNASNALANIVEVLIPSAINADCELIACQWQAMPVQRVLNAVLLQDAMGCGLFVVGHDCTSKPFAVTLIVWPFGN